MLFVKNIFFLLNIIFNENSIFVSSHFFLSMLINKQNVLLDGVRYKLEVVA